MDSVMVVMDSVCWLLWTVCVGSYGQCDGCYGQCVVVVTDSVWWLLWTVCGGWYVQYVGCYGQCVLAVMDSVWWLLWIVCGGCYGQCVVVVTVCWLLWTVCDGCHRHHLTPWTQRRWTRSPWSMPRMSCNWRKACLPMASFPFSRRRLTWCGKGSVTSRSCSWFLLSTALYFKTLFHFCSYLFHVHSGVSLCYDRH